MTDPGAGQYRQRDAASIFVLGLFIATLGLLVLLGSLWIEGQRHALIVNLAAGGLLFLIGLGMLFVARRLRNPRGYSAITSRDNFRFEIGSQSTSEIPPDDPSTDNSKDSV